jgi:hypothetical protein
MKNVSGPQVVTATEPIESPLPAEIQEALRTDRHAGTPNRRHRDDR